MPRTYVYVDGFNLYYGCLRGRPYRWLDLDAFCRCMLPAHDILRINYYTARVGRRTNDPGQSIRQETYLRALNTLPTVRTHFGHFLSHPVRMPLAAPPLDGSKFVLVRKTEEKGSDVNLATHLLADAYESAFDLAILVTNDSDLLAPVELVRNRLGKNVGVLNPHKHGAKVLAKAASFVRAIRPGVLRANQLPDELVDANGTFRKPAGW